MIEVVSPVAYRITLPENWRIHNVLHISRLRPWHENTEVRTEPAESPPPPPPVQDDKLGEFYTVRRANPEEGARPQDEAAEIPSQIRWL